MKRNHPIARWAIAAGLSGASCIAQAAATRTAPVPVHDVVIRNGLIYGSSAKPLRAMWPSTTIESATWGRRALKGRRAPVRQVCA
jgi:hypothetical protein